jgi:hypothetical protein
MMKTLLVSAAAVLSLAGCVAVPYSEPAPAYGYYGPPVVYAPPVSFSFGFSSYGGGHGHGGHHHRHGGGRGHRR